MVSDTLLCLYQLGWVPLAPLGTASSVNSPHTNHTAVCFRRRGGEEGSSLSRSVSTLTLSDLNLGPAGTCDTCLCIQRLSYRKQNCSTCHYLVFRGTPHTVLFSVVTGLQTRAGSSLVGVSVNIASIICDYTNTMPPVINNHALPTCLNKLQVIQLRDANNAIYDDVMSCLLREGFGLVLDVDISQDNSLYFFVKDQPVRPEMKRMKSVRKTNNSKPRVVSFRRKVLTRQFSGGSGNRTPRVKKRPETLAWWQQASTDTSEWETEDEDDVHNWTRLSWLMLAF